MSATELSLDISALVSRAQAGESIDMIQAGEDLAARYPGLGMSADMISRAIGRAAGMVGVWIEGAEEEIPAPAEAAAAEAICPAAAERVDTGVNGARGDFQFDPDAFATALAPEDAILVTIEGEEAAEAASEGDEAAPDAAAPPPRPGMAAALRRALFRA